MPQLPYVADLVKSEIKLFFFFLYKNKVNYLRVFSCGPSSCTPKRTSCCTTHTRAAYHLMIEKNK